MAKTNLFMATSLGGVLAVMLCQPAVAQTAEPVDELIVTATRRAQDVTTIPYNISAIGAPQLDRAGVTDFESLALQVPNLSLNSVGDRSIGAQRPVIRGLNASLANRNGQAQEQAPVATYIGNVPSPAGLFPIDDVQRIEVLRGPQGTLYGAGALGGAVRIIPAIPRLGTFEGSITASAGVVNHSDDMDTAFSGVVNIPIGETLALRVSATNREDAGFIDKYGVFERQGDELSPPALANPGDVANSSAILRTDEDANWSRTNSARFSLNWTPSETIEIIAAYNRSELRGQGGPIDNPNYPGGIDPLDPTLVYPELDEYEVILRAEEPYRRDSEMASLDTSFDVGFATLSSTTSFTETRGENFFDGTFGILALPDVYRPYYIGNPANPRFMSVQNFADEGEVLTQEVRLVSQTGGTFEYVLGAYYQHEERNDTWFIYLPGTPEQTQASGGFPVVLGPDDKSLDFSGDNTFTDTALFGELTWNVNPSWQITAGARVFHQEFERTIDFDIPLFGIFLTNSNETSVDDSIFKLNTSFEYTPGHRAYAIFSQGFRRGGTNSFVTAGIIGEPASILDYVPDTVDNFEIGLKGRFANGLRYTVDVFYDNWQDTQIGVFTPINVWPVVVNGERARSQGFEVELSGNLSPEFSFDVGYAYADAELTEDFCIPVGNGGGGFIPCGIEGLSGTPLPGAPKHSASFNVVYARELGNGDDVELSLNANYRGSLFTTLPSINLINPELEGFWTVNANASWGHGPWRASVYARNIFDERGVLAAALRQSPFLGPLDDITSVTRPRSIGAQVRYRW